MDLVASTATHLTTANAAVGTYGEMTAEALLDGALLSLGAGATGFAFFDWLSLDDGGKILALSTAVALAAPFEDLFFEGKSLTQLDIVTTENVLAWSGMQGQRKTYAENDGSFAFAEKQCHAVSIWFAWI